MAEEIKDTEVKEETAEATTAAEKAEETLAMKKLTALKEFADAQPDTDEVFTVVQEIPEYPGGTEAMMKFLADNIKYPAQAISDSIQGRVFINFIVDAVTQRLL